MMKKPFWSTYWAEIKSVFMQNVLFMSFLLVLVVTSPASYSFMSWYNTEVPATLVAHDPVAYPHKYKQKVEYRYYATFYFPDIKANKTIEIAERTHFHAKAGDVYLFKRSHKLQTGAYNLYSILGLFHCLVTVFAFVFLVGHFLAFTNNHWSVKKKDTSYPYPD